MIAECLPLALLGLPAKSSLASRVGPYGEALVIIGNSKLQELGLILPKNPQYLAPLDPSHPAYSQVTPVWVRIVEKCEDGTFLGFQTDLRSKPFGVKVGPEQMARFYPRKTLVAA